MLGARWVIRVYSLRGHLRGVSLWKVKKKVNFSALCLLFSPLSSSSFGFFFSPLMLNLVLFFPIFFVFSYLFSFCRYFHFYQGICHFYPSIFSVFKNFAPVYVHFFPSSFCFFCFSFCQLLLNFLFSLAVLFVFLYLYSFLSYWYFCEGMCHQFSQCFQMAIQFSSSFLLFPLAFPCFPSVHL